MKKKDLYLGHLIAHKDKPIIKAVTGVHRCGKSSMLDAYEEYLLNAGIKPEAIVHMNFESPEFGDIKDHKQMHEYIQRRMLAEGRIYLLLDEVQTVREWERTINTLRLNSKLDIYIAGSNSRLLNSEMSTLLAGRYIEFHMLPYSFKNYLDFNGFQPSGGLEGYFHRYIEIGGLPGLTEQRDKQTAIRRYISGIYNTVVMKDVIQQNEVSDPALLENVIRYMALNVGSPLSSKEISDNMNKGGRKTTGETIGNYLRMLESAYVLYHVGCYDLKSKQNLKAQGKYYIVDTGLCSGLAGRRGQNYSFVLENIVFFELLRRGFTVKTGSLPGQEVDFVANKPGKTVYYQVAANMQAEEARERELSPLRAIPDNNEKIVLSMDKAPLPDYDGIKNVNLLEFLLE